MADFYNIRTGETLTPCEFYSLVISTDFDCCNTMQEVWIGDNIARTWYEWFLFLIANPPEGCPCYYPYPSILPSISGTPEEGETLTANTGTWSGTAPITYSYQWYRDGVEIPLATANTYLLTGDDIGAMISVKVTANNGCSNNGSSASSLPVGPIEVSPCVEPSFESQPTIDGDTGPGSQLNVIDDGNPQGTAPITITYQWLRDGNTIVGETGQSFTISPSDFGTDISCKVILDNACGQADSVSNAILIPTP